MTWGISSKELAFMTEIKNRDSLLEGLYFITFCQMLNHVLDFSVRRVPYPFNYGSSSNADLLL